MIDKAVKEEVDKMWRKEASGGVGEVFRKLASVMAVVEYVQQAILLSVGSGSGKSPTVLAKNLYEGKRFSIETFI